MENFKEKLIENEIDEELAEMLDKAIHEKFQENILKNIKNDGMSDFTMSLKRFFYDAERRYDLYKTEKTNYLVQKIFYDELVEAIKQEELREDFIPDYSPVLVYKAGGEIIWD